MKYTHLRICFENCETILVSQKHVEHLTLGGMQSTIWLFSNREDDIQETRHANNALVVLSADANISYNPFNDPNEAYTVFSRILRWRDIYSIDAMNNETGEILECYTPWEDGMSEEDNALQKVHINDKGQLVISIKNDNREN